MDSNYYKIGELTKLFDIGSDSIRYYEKVGIIHPFHDPKNGYRLYSLDDIRIIAMTREMLALNFSTDEIRTFIENRSVENTISLFENELNLVKDQIIKLLQKQMTIQGRLSDIQNTLSHKTDCDIRLLEFYERPCIMISDTNVPDDYVSLTALEYMRSHPQRIDTIGGCDCYTLDLEGSNPASDYYRTKNVFFYSESLNYQSNYSLPAGHYLSLYYTGSLKKTKKLLPSLYEYAKNHGLKVTGDPIEFGHIDSYETNHEEEYVIELELPVSR